MIVNYLKIAWRSIVKDKTYATINILGLTVALTASLLAGSVVSYDLSFDKFWSRSGELYRVYQTDKMGDGIFKSSPHSPIGLGTELLLRFPEIEQFANIYTSTLTLDLADTPAGGVVVNTLSADSGVVQMLDFEEIAGHVSPYVAGQKNLLITESFRDKYFKEIDPVGKVVYDIPRFDSSPQPYLITAIIKDIPQNTHLGADVVVLKVPEKDRIVRNQGLSSAQMYFLFKKGTDPAVFASKVNKWYAAHQGLEEGRQIFEFQPIGEVYLNSDFDGDLKVRSSFRKVYAFALVGLLALFIACVNFVNLSTARAIYRLKEISLRKIFGAYRRQLVWQFLVEALLFFLISASLAVLLYINVIPLMEGLLGHDIGQIRNAPYPFILLALLGVMVVAGVFPAWMMSGFRPVQSLRGQLHADSRLSAVILRKSLVVLQFSVASAVLFAFFVVSLQMQYMEKKDLGYKSENLLYVNPVRWNDKQKAFKTRLMQLPGVTSVSFSNWSPRTGGAGGSMTTSHPERKDQLIRIDMLSGDLDFAETIGLQLKEGRFLNGNFETDRRTGDRPDSTSSKFGNEDRSVLITSTTARQLNMEHPGPILEGHIDYQSVGIVEDFHYQSLHKSLNPIFIAHDDPGYGGLFIRVSPEYEKQFMGRLHAIWSEFFPVVHLDMAWMSDILANQYQTERQQRVLFTIFSCLLFFLASLGMLGLAIHSVEKRTREVGIRKVLGASVSGIIRLLSRDFIKLAGLAVVIASPIAWFAMNRWLQDFAYRIEIQWWMFAMAGVTAIAIALLTVSWQAIRAAVANPVESLRTE